MEAILAERANLQASMELVVSSNPNALGLQRAQEAGLATAVVDAKAFASRAAYDRALQQVLTDHRIDFVVLAGFMRILTDEFVAHMAGRMVNIHPSLLPSFTGLHAQRQALAKGVKVAGCTVHFVEPGEVDGGAIIAQAVVPVFADDTEETLAARIQVEEHRLYPAALQRLFSGALRLENGRVVERTRADAVPFV